MGDFDGLQYTTQFNLLMTPVKLAGIACNKQHGYKGLCQFGTLVV